jgi:hypothetical protein
VTRVLVIILCAVLTAPSFGRSAQAPASNAPTAAPTLTARCEGLSELVAALARARDLPKDQDATAKVRDLLDRHSAAHGWLPWHVNEVDLVPPERAARCDPKLLDELPQAFGDAEVSKLWTAQKLAKILERNGRSAAAIDFMTGVLASMKDYDENQRFKRFAYAPHVQGQLGHLYFRAKQWREALEHYQRWGENYDTSTAADAFDQARDAACCRCWLELGSYDFVIGNAFEHLHEDRSWLDSWIAYHAGFADDLALAQLLSGQRDKAEATLASTREQSQGRYTMELDTLERCWKALHSAGAGVDARELASCAIVGCDTLATELLIRGGPSAIEPLLPVFSAVDGSLATQRLRGALMDTGERFVLTAIKEAYDATTSEKLRQSLDSSIDRWRAASAVRVALERK